MKKLFTASCLILAAAASSPLLSAQTPELPYEITFDATNYTTWTIADLNGDGDNWGARTWAWNSNERCVAFNLVSSQNGAANDWFISPAIQLEAGTQYQLTYKFYGGSGSAKWIPVDLKLVTDPSAPDADATIVASYSGGSTNKNDAPESATFTAPADGTFHIGAHMTATYTPYTSGGPAEMSGRLFFKSFSITPLQKATAPAAVKSLTVIPGTDGAETATINFTAPDTDSDGNALSGSVKVNLYREDETTPFFTSAELQAGASSYTTDSEAYAGETWYVAKAENASGEGPETRADAWIGVDVPVAVSGLSVGRDNDGKVKLSWTAPSAALHNGYIDYSTLQYRITRILNGQMKSIGTVSATNFTDSELADNEQVNVAYQVIASSSAGMGASTQSAYFNHGPQLPLPFAESFATCAYATAPWRQEVVKNFDDANYQPEWTLIERATVADNVTDDNPEGTEVIIASQDTDRGFLRFNSNAVGKSKEAAQGRLVFPAIDFSTIRNPVLTFYMFRETYYTTNPATNGGYRDDFLTVEASADNGTFTAVSPEFHRYGNNNDWVLCEVPLYAMAGRSRVQVAFTGNGFGGGPMYIDNVRIIERAAFDLQAVSLSGPARVRIGEHGAFVLSVKNAGGAETADYSVELYKDGTKVLTENGTSVKPGQTVSISFDYVPEAGEEGQKSVFTAKVAFAEDLDMSNNESNSVESDITAALLPAVTGLKAVNNEGIVELNWGKADYLPAATLVEQDGFESYEPFVIDTFGDFTCYDLDKRVTFGIGAAAGVTYPNSGEKMAFQVFAPALTNIDESELRLWAPHDGSNMLVAPQASAAGDVTSSNDWLVFPRLSGNAHVIKLFARSLSDTYSEFVQGFYATTANPTDPDDFMPCPDGGDISYAVPVAWTELSYSVPAGAKFFALRHVSADGYALMVDDVTYQRSIPDATAIGLSGYNIYCNGTKVNDAPVDASTRSFTHRPSTAGEQSYTVTAVYPDGESTPCDAASVIVDTTGLENLDTEAYTVSINGLQISVEGSEKLHVALLSPAGQTVASQYAATCTVEAPAPGIYILTVGTRAIKIVLR
ncbi:MAG: choice-of-anchor J domain-containing protein [Muribaculaceae bacterium]